MKLKRLDIHGFKSFYHRTTVLFDDGITAVVGPNGCGKSNIVDAIKWVMGEQGPKNLRGSAMEDIIFNGTDKRGPMGMCEVRLTFENDGTDDRPDRWNEAGQIELERRLERSKGSDYLINRRRCRLSDIHDLLAGTGIGTGPGGRRAYAIIEQGQVDQIVSAKAEERRLFIEEAAGVTRYRQRRKVAERRMAETRLNLERVDDVIGEIERQMRSLHRQAKKAERYRQYRDEAFEIGIRLTAEDCRNLDQQRNRHIKLADELNQTLVDAVVAVQNSETQRANAQLAVKKAADDVEQASRDLRMVEEKGLLARERLAGHGRERDALAAQLHRAKVDLETGEGRRSELETERDETSTRLEELESQADGETQEVARSEETKKDAVHALLEARANVERLLRQESEEIQAVAQARADVDSAMRRQGELMELIQRIEERTERIASETEAHDVGMAALDKAAQECIDASEKLRSEFSLIQEKLALHREELNAAVEAEAGVRDTLVSLGSRRQSLRDMESQGDDLGEGARALLELSLDGVIGPVADLVSVPEELELAAVAAFGNCLQGVVVADRSAGRSALTVLAESNRGRALVGCQNEAMPKRPDEPPSGDGVLGFLADLLDPSGPNSLLVYLLDDAVCVKDLDAAETLVDTGWTGPIVTMTGERVSNPAVMAGGVARADGALLRRRRELVELDEKIPILEAQHSEVLNRLNTLREAQTAARTELESVRGAMQTAEIDRARALKDAEQARRESERLKSVLTQAGADLQQAKGRLDSERQKEDAGRLALDGAESARQDRQRFIEEAEETVRKAQIARDDAVAQLHDVRARAMARHERVLSLKTVVSRLSRQLSEIEVRRQRVSAVGVDVEKRLKELVAAEQKDRHIVEVAERDAEGLAAQLASVRLGHEAAQESIGTIETDLDNRRKERDELRQRIGELSLKSESLELRLESLRERLRERYQVELAEALKRLDELGAPSPEDRTRLDELNALLDKMGDVNLAAIDEFNAVEERHGFLTSQRDDLNAGLDDLTNAIDEIDRTSRTLFAETFEAVNGHFKQLFPRLFRGGEAELILQEPDDLLTTGIEMRVRPPGKKVQSVELMSGGEKAMCAIALIFAVFRFRPSPFCLLDEVDAPLDEANIGRFNEVVREIAQTSQVVLVTHNKRTMEIADVLYGVTMEESGVSKLVGVRMS